MWMLKSRLMTTRTKSKDTYQHFVSVNVMTACLLNKRSVERRSGNGEKKTKEPSLASGTYRILKHTGPIARGKTEMGSLPRKQTAPSWCNSNRILSLNCQTIDNWDDWIHLLLRIQSCRVQSARKLVHCLQRDEY